MRSLSVNAPQQMAGDRDSHEPGPVEDLAWCQVSDCPLSIPLRTRYSSTFQSPSERASTDTDTGGADRRRQEFHRYCSRTRIRRPGRPQPGLSALRDYRKQSPNAEGLSLTYPQRATATTIHQIKVPVRQLCPPTQVPGTTIRIDTLRRRTSHSSRRTHRRIARPGPSGRALRRRTAAASRPGTSPVSFPG